MSETLIKPITFKWKVAGKEVTEIEVRPSTMKDVCESESETSVTRPNSFSIQMACLQIVRAGEFTGPFVPSHFAGMRPQNFQKIAAALQEADKLGED